MSTEEIAAIKKAFSESLEPVTNELRAIHEALDQHGRLLNEHAQLLRSIDQRLPNVEGILDGVEIMVRKKTG